MFQKSHELMDFLQQHGRRPIRRQRHSRLVWLILGTASQSQHFWSVSLPECKKTYIYNWLSAHSLWIHQITNHCLSSKNKIAAHEILGEQVIELAQGLKMALADVVWWETQVRGFFFLSADPFYILLHRFMSQPSWTCCSSSCASFFGNCMNSIFTTNSMLLIVPSFHIFGHLTKPAPPARHSFLVFSLATYGQN